MKIGIDVDSGERPFAEYVDGVLQSAESNPHITYFLIGNSGRIRAKYPNIDKNSHVILVNAKQVISMEDSPILGVKRKTDSTVVVGMNLIKNNTIDVFFSPGNTGATVAGAVLILGLIPGVKKPAMATFFPRTGGGETLILDVGANPESKEEYFYTNAHLGKLLYRHLMDKPIPSIGLLSMGTEYGKGSNMVKKTYDSLKTMQGFIGNVEAYNIVNGSVDVVVCDGFTGNSIIKIAESMKKLFSAKLKEYFLSEVFSSITKRLIFGTLEKLGAKTGGDFTDKFLPRYYGGAPLLGVNGLVIVGHGMSSKKDLINSIEYADMLFKKDIIKKFTSDIKRNKFFK